MKSGNKAGHDGRRVKYGTFSLVFTAVVLALIIVINIVFTSLSLTGALTADLTAESFTEIGEESVSLLSALGKDLDITITFMSPRDRFDDSANAYNGINLTALVRDLAENYARRFDGSGDLGTVRVEYKELDSRTALSRKPAPPFPP